MAIKRACVYVVIRKGDEHPAYTPLVDNMVHFIFIP